MRYRAKYAMLAAAMFTIGTAAFATGSVEQATSASNLTEPGTFPIVTESAKLSIYVGVTEQVRDMSTNEFTQWYEEKTNVRVEWEQVPLDEAMDKLNVLLASGDYPEVISVKDGFSRAELMLYGDQGILQPLNSAIESQATNVGNMLADSPYIADAITAPGGNIYTLPYISEVYHSSMSNKIWVYMPWLAELGISPPQTTEEFYDMLVAFKTQDPNGNGKSDEIPLSGCVGGWRTELGWTIMNAFVYSGDAAMGNRLKLEDGIVSFVANTAGWRDGVRYYRRLYREGLIAPESFTQDRNAFRQMGEHPGDPILGSALAGWFGYFVINEGESGRYKEYETIPPLEGPTGLRQTNRYNFLVQPHYSVTDRAPNVDLAVRYVDYLYSFEGATSAGSGIFGVGWTDADPGAVNVLGEPAQFKLEDTYGTLANYKWHHSMPLWGNSENAEKWQSHPDGLEGRLYRYTKQQYEPYAREEILPYMWFDGNLAQEVAELENDLNTYVRSSFAEFVTGARDIEGSDWDRYLSRLEQIGVSRYVDYYQQAYDATR